MHGTIKPFTYKVTRWVRHFCLSESWRSNCTMRCICNVVICIIYIADWTEIVRLQHMKFYKLVKSSIICLKMLLNNIYIKYSISWKYNCYTNINLPFLWKISTVDNDRLEILTLWERRMYWFLRNLYQKLLQLSLLKVTKIII